MLLLHRYVTGEYRIRINPNKWDFKYDTAISLELYNNGVPKSGNSRTSPDMALNNLNNIHWVSLIEPIETSIAPTKVKAERSAHEAYSIFESGVTFTENTTDLKENYLDLCGFNIYLQQLETKATELVKSYQLAAKEAFDIVKLLKEEKNNFIAANSTMTPQEFAKKSQLIIKNSVKDNLAHHRGIGLILNGLLNAVITLANLFIRLSNLIYDKHKLINSDRIATKSMQQVTSLHNSLNALLDVRAREDQKHIEPSFRSKFLN